MMYLGNQAVGLNTLISGRVLTLNTSDTRDAYVSKVVGSQASFTNSAATYTYVNAIPAYRNNLYIIEVLNGPTISSTNIRNSVLVDNQMIVKEVYELQTQPNQKNIMAFRPSVDGNLILCVDNQYQEIQIYELTIS